MIRLNDLIGQQAVSLATAERTGNVKGIILDNNRITAVELDDLTIDAAAVRTFEGDVLTYDHGHPSATNRPGVNPKGKRVLAVHGDELGTIADLEIDADGTVSTIVLDNGERLNGARLRAIGSYAAITAAELPPPTGLPVNS